MEFLSWYLCLRVFCNGDKAQFESLKEGAMSLGSAFQKVNFLRDLKADKDNLGRLYFPGMNMSKWSPELKSEIEADIAKDFKDALLAINKLPSNSKYGVYTAYRYYYKLFKKLENATFQQGQDEKRTSKTNTKEYTNASNNQLPEARKYFNTTEILNKKALPLKQEYKQKVQDYFKQKND